MRALKVTIASVLFLAALFWFLSFGMLVLNAWGLHQGPRTLRAQIVLQQEAWERSMHQGKGGWDFAKLPRHSDAFYLWRYGLISIALGTAGVISAIYLSRISKTAPFSKTTNLKASE